MARPAIATTAARVNELALLMTPALPSGRSSESSLSEGVSSLSSLSSLSSSSLSLLLSEVSVAVALTETEMVPVAEPVAVLVAVLVADEEVSMSMRAEQQRSNC